MFSSRRVVVSNVRWESSAEDRRRLPIDRHVSCKVLLIGVSSSHLLHPISSDVNVEDKPLGRITFQVSK